MVNGQVVHGTLDDTDFTDAWRVTLSANATITINATSSDVDLDVTIYDPKGVALTLDKQTGKTIQLKSVKVGDAGTYVIMVSRAGGAITHDMGNYTLKVKVTDSLKNQTLANTVNFTVN